MIETYAVDWEKAILAKILKEPDALEEYPLLVNGSPFRDSNLNSYLMCMKSVYEDMAQSDLAAFKINIQINSKYKDMTGLDGRELNNQIKDNNPLSLTSDEVYAHFVNKYQTRQLSMLCGGLSTCDQGNEEAPVLIEHLEASIKRIEDVGVSEVEITNKEAIEVLYEKMAKVNEDDTQVYMKTGIKGLDDIIGGFEKSTTVVVAGKPSMGKTALGLTIGSNISLGGKRGAFISLEMTKIQLIERLVQVRAEANSMAVARARCSQKEQADFMQASKQIANNEDLIVSECTKYDLASVRAAIKRCKKRNPDIEFIILDYIQLIESNNNRVGVGRETIEEASKSLTRLAKDLDVAMILLAQTNRKSEDLNPKFSDLDGASQLEKDASIIIMISRDLDAQRDTKSKGGSLRQLESKLFVPKSRNGETGVADCIYDAPITKFKSVELDDGYEQEI